MTSQCLRKYLAVATTVVGIVAGFLSLKVTAAASDSVITGIADITNFMETCPTNDSAYAQIRDAIEILVDGRPIVAPVSCTEPFSSVPIAQLSDELILLQALRTAYYMSSGTERRLPWTTLSLWDWMTLRIDGVNIRTVPGQSFYCCDQINGRYYIAVSRNDPTRLAQFRTWPTLSVVLTLLAHETRHADPGAPGHTTGCLKFPVTNGRPRLRCHLRSGEPGGLRDSILALFRLGHGISQCRNGMLRSCGSGGRSTRSSSMPSTRVTVSSPMRRRPSMRLPPMGGRASGVANG